VRTTFAQSATAIGAIFLLLSAWLLTSRMPLISALPEGELARAWAMWAAWLALGLAAVAFFLPGRKFALASLAAAAAALAWARAPLPREPPSQAARPVSLQGRLLRGGPQEELQAWGVLDRLAGPDGAPFASSSRLLSGRPEIRFKTSQLLRFPGPGQTLQVSGLLVPGPFGFYLDRARWAVLSKPTELSFQQKLRNWVRQRLQRNLTADHAGLARALLLGERVRVPYFQLLAYRQLGLLHLLAISGMHFWFWSMALRRLLPRRLHFARPILLLTLAALADFGPAVVRALTAVFLRDFFSHRGLQISGRHLWTAALWTELALLPARASNLGLILSYLATAALILGFPPRHSSYLRRVLQPSAAAFLGTMPSLHSFQGTIEPWSILWTPVLAILLPIRLFAAALAVAPLGHRLADPLYSAAALLEGYFLQWAQAFPFTPWVCPELSTPALTLAAAAGLWAFSRAGPLRTHKFFLIALPLATASLISATARPALVCLPIGHGLSTALTGHRASLFFDAGSSDLSATNLVDRRMLPLLQKLNAQTVSAYVQSHQDGDHVNAMAKMKRYLPGPTLATPPGIHRSLRQLAPWQVYLVACPSAQEGTSNEGGYLLDVRNGPQRAVLLGDQYGFGLRQLCKILPPGPIDVLLLPHHGLTTDGLAELLDHLQPRIAWASCGYQDLPLPAAPLLRKRGIALRTTLAGPLFLFAKDV
jgi:ComEC/Rec2-related protein